MKSVGAIPVPDPAKAFLNFQEGLARALHVSKDELSKRVAQDDAERNKRIGYSGDIKKRGPKGLQNTLVLEIALGIVLGYILLNFLGLALELLVLMWESLGIC